MGMVFNLFLPLAECEQSTAAFQFRLELNRAASDWIESFGSSPLASAAPLVGPGTENGT